MKQTNVQGLWSLVFNPAETIFWTVKTAVVLSEMDEKYYIIFLKTHVRFSQYGLWDFGLARVTLLKASRVINARNVKTYAISFCFLNPVYVPTR